MYLKKIIPKVYRILRLPQQEGPSVCNTRKQSHIRENHPAAIHRSGWQRKIKEIVYDVCVHEGKPIGLVELRENRFGIESLASNKAFSSLQPSPRSYRKAISFYCCLQTKAYSQEAVLTE